MWELEVLQNGHDHDRIGEEGDDPHGAATRGAEQRQHLVDASEQHGPSDASRVAGASRLSIEGGLRPWPRARWARERGSGRLGFGPANGRDGGTELGVRREDAVISVAVDARGRDKAGDPLEKPKWREHELGAAVRRGLGYPTLVGSR